jgi:glycerophosphoryl diester phosphodiesterase
MIIRIGHRGAAGNEPENTLRSFQRALDTGVDLIELDVQQTKDGHLVVLHDKRVDRTTNGKGDISEMSLAEAKGLDAGKGEKIPLLKEVLQLIYGKRTGLMVEIKSPGIAAQVVEEVSGFSGTILFASFLHAEVLAVRKLLPDAQTLALIEAIPVQPTAFAKDAGVTHVGISIESISREFVDALQTEGYKVFVYTANDLRDIDWLKSLEVDGIISNYPERLDW